MIPIVNLLESDSKNFSSFCQKSEQDLRSEVMKHLNISTSAQLKAALSCLRSALEACTRKEREKGCRSGAGVISSEAVSEFWHLCTQFIENLKAIELFTSPTMPPCLSLVELCRTVNAIFTSQLYQSISHALSVAPQTLSHWSECIRSLSVLFHSHICTLNILSCGFAFKMPLGSSVLVSVFLRAFSVIVVLLVSTISSVYSNALWEMN
jgi:hypothetical protein